MKVKESYIKGCFVIEPKVFRDSRGYFFESFNKKTFHEKTGLNINFVQDNQSYSTFGTLRGLHFQKGNSAQAKLVRVVEGSVLDVAVDIREGSPTFGKYFSIELSSINNLQLFVPRGFAHGFVVLSNEAIFQYKCDNYYDQNSESGIIYNDPLINIDWKVKNEFIKVSEKDEILPNFKK